MTIDIAGYTYDRTLPQSPVSTGDLDLLLSTAFDALLGKSYIEARSQKDRRTAGVLFVRPKWKGRVVLR